MSIPGAIANLLIRGGLPDPLPADPMPLLKQWFDEGKAAKAVPNPDAMVVASVSPDGHPSARVVLCRRITVAPPEIVFFTNYQSRKAQELSTTGVAAAVFHWDSAERQARIEGRVEKTTDAESDEYFVKRALLSRLGSWASDQSKPIASRKDLIERALDVMKRFGVSAADVIAGKSDAKIPRPPHWGGFVIQPTTVELWAGGQGRLHDRAVWTRVGAGWTAQRLQP